MLRVEPLDRKVIDAWPIDGSGLPARVANSTRTEGIIDVGQLRTWPDSRLLKLRSLGRISLRHIHAFFNLCNEIEAGRTAFGRIEEVLRLFLDNDEYDVLASRYGFDRPTIYVSRKSMTLQEIGNRDHKTRERIRQIEEAAKERLSSKLGAVCLEPFCLYFTSLLKTMHRSADGQEVISAADQELFGTYNPCALLLLLCDLQPSRLTFRNGYFSLLTSEALNRLEQACLQCLEDRVQPTALLELVDLHKTTPDFTSTEDLVKATALTMDHCALAAATVDDRYFLYTRGMSTFLTEIMRTIGRPEHFRTITAAINERLKPRSRKGAGYILETLNAHPQCKRVERGIYALQSP